MTRTSRIEEGNMMLLDTVNDNCNAVLEMALETIRSRHIPLVCISNEDFRNILGKYQMHSLSSVEEIVGLIALTDYCSCACANSELVNIRSSLELLRKIWRNLFLKLSPGDITADQLHNIIKVTKRCSERTSSKWYKKFLKTVPKMAQKCLNRLHKLPKERRQGNCRKKPIFVGVKESQQQRGDCSKESIPNTASILSPIEDNEGNNINNVNKDSCHIKKAGKQSHISTKNTSRGTTSITKIAKDKRRNKRNVKVKGSPDIAKFILKSCENTITKKEGEKAESDTQHKRKFNQINADETICDKGQNMQHSSTDDVDLPYKKPCLDDDFINGKVNAFKMLMKPHRTGKQMQNNKCIISV